ncbi:MAG: DUF5643 domain-containing protein [Ruminiclostridium sp.]|nr:DUF5643 domain-containing protein [Ruminiclostridium sp.]
MKEVNEMNSKNFNEVCYDEKILDEYIENMKKDEIAVPKELEQRINVRISTLKRPVRTARYIIAASFIFIFAFIISIRINPAIASYAAEIPGFAAVVGWLRGDSGIRNAHEHGYGGISPITVEQDGFILEITDIFFDEDRLRFSVIAAGPEVASMLNKKDSMPSAVQDDNKTARAGEEGPLEDGSDNLHLQFDFKDFDENGYTMISHEQNSEFLAYEVEKSFNSGEAAAFIKKEPDVINLGLKIKKGDEEVYSFENIQLAFDSSKFKHSTVYNQNRNIVLQHTEIMIDSLTISPTRMKLQVSFNMEGGYFFTGFENPRLEDENGNIYKSGEIVSRDTSPNKRTLYFVPSTYFDRQPEKLYFCFDGIRIGSEEGKSFTLSLDEQYPKKLLYMGKEISVTRVKWYESGKLTVEFEYPEEGKILRIQGVNIVDNKGVKRSGTGSYIWQGDSLSASITKSFSEFEVEKRASYDMEFEFPGYLIPSGMDVELALKK